MGLRGPIEPRIGCMPAEALVEAGRWLEVLLRVLRQIPERMKRDIGSARD